MWRMRFAFLVCVISGPAHAADVQSLFAAWQETRAKAHQQMAQQFDKRLQQIRSNRSQSPEARDRYIRELQQQRDNFAKNHHLPASDLMLSATIAYLDSLHRAAIPLRVRLDRQLQQTVGTSEFAAAYAVKQQWASSLPGQDELAAQTEFRGNRTFLKGAAVDFSMSVHKFEKGSFSGHIWQDAHSVSGKSGWAFDAQLEGNQFLLSTTKMLHGQARRLSFRGYVIERRIVMTLTHKDGRPLTGDFVSIWKK